MHEMTHRIRRQILDIELPREAGAVALQRRVARVFLERVLPELERLFDRIAPADRFLQIRRLEIDLGQMSETNWEQTFVERCREQVARKMGEIPFEPDKSGPPNAAAAAPEEHALSVLLHFLETGILPWYGREGTLAQLETQLGELAAPNPAFFRDPIPPAVWEYPDGTRGDGPARRAAGSILDLLRQKDTALQRLVWQFSPAFAALVVGSALGFPAGWIEQAVEIYRSQTGSRWDASERLYFLRRLLAAAPAAWRALPPSPQLLAHLFFAQPPAAAGQAPDLPGQLPAPADRPAHAKEAGQPPDPVPAQKETPVQTAIESEPQMPPRPADERESIPVDSAGLVLLAPYLPPFFDALELLTQGKVFVAPEGQYRALYLLHFLATGRENPEEPALALPKILCGMDIETPVPAEIPLPETEKSECVQLLEAVIRNWPVLKNTGPDGLRQAFLQRAGLLRRTDSGMGWLLRPERLGQDILLEQLPWTYSVVRLPWMEKMLQVEW